MSLTPYYDRPSPIDTGRRGGGPLRFGSVCSGIEAASAAWIGLGWECAFVSEIEAFPSAVLAHHYPDTPNLGNMTKIIAADWRGKIDLLVGGTPCQAFSVAGLRKSLADDRGNLTLKFVELVHGIEPEYVVWENVPGVLSTPDNAFGCFLAGLVGAAEPIIPRTSDGRWTSAGVVCGPRRAAAWRVLDAQYIAVAGDSAVPQRRARVFVVSRDFRNLGVLETPSPERNANRVCGLLAEILFESESLPRHSAPSRQAGARVARDSKVGFAVSGHGSYRSGVGTVRAHGGDAHDGSETLMVEKVIPKTCGALTDGAHNGGGHGTFGLRDGNPDARLWGFL